MMIRRLLRTVALAARTLRRGSPSGGQLTPRRPDPNTQLVILSPGRAIPHPDERHRP